MPMDFLSPGHPPICWPTLCCSLFGLILLLSPQGMFRIPVFSAVRRYYDRLGEPTACVASSIAWLLRRKPTHWSFEGFSFLFFFFWTGMGVPVLPSVLLFLPFSASPAPVGYPRHVPGAIIGLLQSGMPRESVVAGRANKGICQGTQFYAPNQQELLAGGARRP